MDGQSKHPGQSGSNDPQFLSILSGVEQQIAQLRQSHAEHNAMRQQLASWDETLKAKEADLADQARELSQQAEASDRRARELEQRLKEHTAQVKALEQEDRRVQSARASLEQEAQSYREQAAALERRQQEAQALAQRLAEREAKAAKFEDELKRLQSEVAARGSTIEAEARRLADREREIESKVGQREREVEQMRQRLERHEASLKATEQSLAQREQAAAAKDEEQRRREIGVKAREDQLIARASALNDSRERLTNQAADLAVKERGLKEELARFAEVERRSAEFESRMREAERQAAERTERVRLLEDELTSSIELTEGLERRVLELTERGATPEQAQALAAQLSSDWQTKLAASNATIEQLREELAYLQNEADRAQSLSDEELQALRARLAETSDHADGRVETLEQRLHEADAEIVELRSVLATRGDDEAAAVGRDESAWKAALAKAESEARAARDEADRVREEADAELARLREQFREQLEQAQTITITDVDDGAALLRQQLAASSSRLLDLEADRDRALDEAAKADAQLTALKAELERARRDADQAVADASQSGNMRPLMSAQSLDGDVGGLIEAVETRRRRLSSVKRALRQRESKLRTVSEHVRERYEQAEQVLATRDEVERARGMVTELKKRAHAAQSRAAQASAAKILAFSLGSIAILAGLSWAAATQIFPATYATKVSIFASAGEDRTLTGEELDIWRRYVEGRISDPATREAAAERFERAGILTLATPGKIQERLKNDLTVLTPNPGEMQLELRGLGKDRTARELKYYVNALVSEINATAQQRADAATTLIREDDLAAATPITDPRPLWAGIFTLVSSLLAGLVGFVLWKRLSDVKDAFEESGDVDAIMDRTAMKELHRSAAA